ncbi:tripartite motif-containing protein 2 [Hydra vulgaris]|uniref:tripartite motif-containing protein 2 n=1 Tax=Hydra vulgaris TaxID=6087 RepID=UPI0002B470B6|nr:tripartite motif-containing protein 2 [Hydra vulgaris]
MEYSTAKLVQKIGEEEINEGDFLLSQCQHLIADDDTIYVSTVINRNIRAIDAKSGQFKRDIGEIGFSDESINMAAGMAFFGDNLIMVADLNGNKVQYHNKITGDYVKKFDADFYFPACVSVSKSNNVYIGEVGDENKKIRCFNTELVEVCSAAVAGDRSLTGINYLVHDNVNNRVIASDSDDGFVHVFSSNLEHIFSISEDDSDSGQLNNPSGVAVDKDGNILICDLGNNAVKVFDKNGKFLSELGGSSFLNPYDVFFSVNGSVLVLDGDGISGWSRIQVFKV